MDPSNFINTTAQNEQSKHHRHERKREPMSQNYHVAESPAIRDKVRTGQDIAPTTHQKSQNDQYDMFNGDQRNREMQNDANLLSILAEDTEKGFLQVVRTYEQKLYRFATYKAT